MDKVLAIASFTLLSICQLSLIYYGWPWGLLVIVAWALLITNTLYITRLFDNG